MNDEQRLQSILHAYLQAVDRGGSPDRNALLDAHPDLRDELAEYFADASKLERLAKSLRTASFGAPGGLSPPTPAELADRFPQYEILELLGQGGMGAVYKARQKRLDRLVALKILPGELGTDPAFAERFLREAKALARLSHPNIVAVHDVGQTNDGLCYFVMEYVDGVNLRQAMRVGSMTPKETLAIVPQICAALQFAHDEGIVHRDIKPENVLLDRKGRIKIADFGLAKLLGGDSDVSLTGTHQVMGTLRYMAPEQMEGSKQVDHRADIYSLGVVFYELLTGEVPMGRFAPPSKKVQIDVRLDEVVLRALEREPEQRWQQASEVKTEVEAISKDRLHALPADAAPRKAQPNPGAEAANNPKHGTVLGSLLAAILIPVVFALVWATVGFAEAAVWGSLTWLAVHGPLLLWLPRGMARPVLWTSWTLACVAVYFTLWMADAPATSWWCRGLGYIDRHYWPYEGQSKCSVTLTPKDRTFTRVTITNEREIRRHGYGSTGVVNWSGPGWSGERTRDDFYVHLETLQGDTAPILEVNAREFAWPLAQPGAVEFRRQRPLTVDDVMSWVDTGMKQARDQHEIKDLGLFRKQCEALVILLRLAMSNDDATGSWKRGQRPVGYLAFFVGRDELDASLKGTPFYWEDYVGAHESTFKPVVSILYVGVPIMLAVWLAGLVLLMRSGREPKPSPGAWADRWRALPRPVRLAVHVALVLVYIVCVWSFFAYNGASTASSAGQRLAHHITIGQPSPWFVFHSDAAGSSVSFRFLAWSNLAALLGLLALWGMRRLELIERTKVHSLWWHFGLWIFMLLIASGIGVFSTIMHQSAREKGARSSASAILAPRA